MSEKKYKYDVVLSFAGEDRNYVEKIAENLRSNNIKVFYDKYEEADLWGRDLYTHLDDVYQNKAKYCIIFISKWYANKNWTNHERISAQARAFTESEEYILPIRLDNTQIPGIRPTVGYIDGNKYTAKQICSLIIKKLNKPEINLLEDNNVDFEELLIPKIRRTITDLEKKKFLNASFSTIKEYFDKALKKLKNSNPHIETELEEITNSKFTASVYVEGELKVQCKIWIGGLSNSGNGISYSEGARGIDINNDNSLNDNATVEDDGIEMFFSVLGMSFGYVEGMENINLKELHLMMLQNIIGEGLLII